MKRSATREQLSRVLDSLGESAHFCMMGMEDMVLPGLMIDGVGHCPLPLQPGLIRKLVQVAAQAPYGRGEETIVDTDVRRVWQIEPEHISILNPDWEKLLERILRDVRASFGITKAISASFYKMLIYEEGSFFAPHRDSEKEEGMFATLVVCLPSAHQGGELIVHHDGQSNVVDFSSEEYAFGIGFAAFYADCRHEIQAVTSGARVTLIYNLSLKKQKKQPKPPSIRKPVEQIASLLPALFSEEQEKVAIPLKHEYTAASLHPDTLKGQDRASFAHLTSACEREGYQLFLALLTCYQEGGVDESTLGWSRYGYEPDDEDAEFFEVFEEEQSLSNWTSPQGRVLHFGDISLELDEVLFNGDLDSFVKTQTVHEATGNEGVSMERWYHQAVAVIWPVEHHFRILASAGQDAGISGLQQMITESEAPALDEDLHDFAHQVISRWRFGYCRQSDPDENLKMLKILHQLANEHLIDRFLCEVMSREQHGGEGFLLRDICDELGWESFRVALCSFFSSFDPREYESKLSRVIHIYRGLFLSCSSLLQQEIAHQAGEALLNTIKHLDSSTGPESEPRKESFAVLYKTLYVMGEGDWLGQFISHALSHKRYDFLDVFLPALQKMKKAAPGSELALQHHRDFVTHCVEALQKRTTHPPLAPEDWAVPIQMPCRCEDCQIVETFLHASEEQVLRLPRKKELRQHLHREIDDKRGCDLDHVTERKGRPFTLVLTKNRATYKAQCRRYEADLKWLEELRDLQEALTQVEVTVVQLERSTSTGLVGPLQLGQSVVVHEGVVDPDDESLSLGGWRGRVASIEEGEEERIIELEWDSHTLLGLPPDFLLQSIEQELDWTRMVLYESEVSRCMPRDTQKEVALAITSLTDEIHLVN